MTSERNTRSYGQNHLMLRRLHPKHGLPLTCGGVGGTLRAGSKKWTTGKIRTAGTSSEAPRTVHSDKGSKRDSATNAFAVQSQLSGHSISWQGERRGTLLGVFLQCAGLGLKKAAGLVSPEHGVLS